MPEVSIVGGKCDLGMYDWAVAGDGDLLQTGGASSCGIVAVLNHTQGLAWMVHQPSPDMYSADVEEMLDDAEAGRNEGDDVEICMAGCEPGWHSKKDRAKLITLAAASFPGVVPELHWSKQCLKVWYDAATGTWMRDYTCP